MESKPASKFFKGKTLLVILVIVIISAVSVVGGVFLGRFLQPSEPSPPPPPPDISGVQMINNETFWSMKYGGMGFEGGRPVDNYDIDAYLAITIYNPTEYSALLKIYGAADVSVSYEVFEGEPRSFSVSCHNTQNFTIPPYSQDVYRLYLLRTQKNCDVPESMTVTFSNVEVKELYREAVDS